MHSLQPQMAQAGISLRTGIFNIARERGARLSSMRVLEHGEMYIACLFKTCGHMISAQSQKSVRYRLIAELRLSPIQPELDIMSMQ